MWPAANKANKTMVSKSQLEAVVKGLERCMVYSSVNEAMLPCNGGHGEVWQILRRAQALKYHVMLLRFIKGSKTWSNNKYLRC